MIGIKVLVYYPDNIRQDGYKNGYDKVNGHIEVVRKNPVTRKIEGISDGVGSLRKPDAIFIPVKQA